MRLKRCAGKRSSISFVLIFEMYSRFVVTIFIYSRWLSIYTISENKIFTLFLSVVRNTGVGLTGIKTSFLFYGPN